MKLFLVLTFTGTPRVGAINQLRYLRLGNAKHEDQLPKLCDLW